MSPPNESDAPRARQLDHARRMEALGRLAGGVAHDFNNLLTSIRGLGALALDELDASHPIRPDLEEILKAAVRATELTGELLAFSGKQRMEASAVDVNALVDDVVRRIRPRHAGVDLRVATDPAFPFVAADAARLAQAVENLLVSAAQAAEEKGTISVATARATVGDELAALPAGDYAAIRVADEGHLTPDQLDAVFEPFAAPRSATKGNGLLLAVAYGIVRRAGGILVASSQPTGTLMTAYLPLAPAGPDGRPT